MFTISPIFKGDDQFQGLNMTSRLKNFSTKGEAVSFSIH